MSISKVSEAERIEYNKKTVWIITTTTLFFLVMILSGCATGRTGTHVEPSFEDISRIEKVGLCVVVERGFAVRLQYVSNADRSWLEQILVEHLGRPVGSFVYGGVIGIISEYSPDRQATVALTPESTKIKSAYAIGNVMVNKLETDKVFPEIELVQSQSFAAAQESGIDTFLTIKIRRWGLRPPLGTNYDTGDKAQTQLELDVNLKLISTATRKIIWERDEFYIDNESYSLGDFKSKAGLLASRMEYALQLVCDRTANEIYRTR